MRLIRKARLHFQEGDSDKVYEVDLCDLGGSSGSKRYLVNFRYGRRDKALRAGTKTTSPVEFAEANKLFDSVVVSKTNKGYQEMEQTTPTPQAEDVAAASATVSEDVNAVEQALLNKLERARQGGLDEDEIKRLVWRIGERGVQSCAARVADLVQQGDALLDYCIAWTLGRLADKSYAPVLDNLHKRYGLNHIGRMARDAYLHLCEAAQREEIYSAIRSQLPHGLAESITQQDSATTKTQLDVIVSQSQPATADLLCDLYTLALDDTPLHQVLREIFRHVELKPNIFRAVRRIYKQAEFRRDAEMFGLLTYRFEVTRAYVNKSGYHDWVQIPGTYDYLEFDKEIIKENSRLAYTNFTRDYLRRRSWRNLRRLAQLKDKGFVQQATALLLCFSDDDAGREFTSEYYNYDQRRNIRIKYGAFAYFIVFNYLLNLNNPRVRLAPRGNKWLTDESVAEVADFRCEAFPELWDEQPDYLLKLLMHSRCAPVHVFAARALRLNTDYCNQLQNAQLAAMLAQPYECTVQLALGLVRNFIKANKMDAALLKALLNSPLAEARQLGIDCINANNDWLQQDTDLLFACLSSRYEDIRLWMRRLATELVFEQSQLNALCARLIAHVIQLGNEDEQNNSAIIDDIGWLLINVYTDFSRQISLDVIDDLLNHANESVAALAAKLLINHAIPVEQLPPRMLRQLMESERETLRALGVQLFAQLPEEVLLAQPDLIVALAVSTDSQVRQAARPIVKQLAARHTDFAKAALTKLMDYLFRAEPNEGFHDDLLTLIKSDLDHVTGDIDKNMTWRLLQSRSKAAKRYGEFLLARFSADDFSVRQLARLAGHEIVAVREFAWNAFNHDVARIKQDALNAIIIFDTDWPNTREFARQYFDQHFSDADWTPELLIAICDNLRDDVQRYGQELVMRFFKEGDGMYYLTRLSEHTSINVQMFASGFLKQYAGGDVEKIKALLPYFISVLSLVNRARVIKDRINQFLAEEALAAEEIARLVAYIYSRQSVTMAINDKSTCIQMLYGISQKYPGISSPLKLKSVANYPTAGAGH